MNTRAPLSLPIAITALLFISSSVASAQIPVGQHQYGVKSDKIETFDGLVLWTGWNGSFSETYLPESETYNWILFFGPTGVFAGLTSAESTYSSVDVYAAINMFFGAADVGTTMVPWSVASGFYGIGYAHSVSIVPNMLSVDFGITFFRDDPHATALLDAIQFSIGASFSNELISIPFVPSVSLDTQGNISEQDTGFWPVLLWDADAAAADPIKAVADALRKRLSEDDSTYTAIHQKQMAQSLLPAFVAMSTTSGTTTDAFSEGTTMGDYLGQYLDTLGSTSSSAHTIGAAADDVELWLANGDTSIPAKVISEIPISISAVQGAFQNIKTGVGSGFEAAYRHGYDEAVNNGTREANTIYSDCLQRQHCLMGDACVLEVPAEETASLVSGSTAADFDGAEVLFDAAPSDFITSGDAGQQIASSFVDGVATYSFVRNEETSIILGVSVPASTSPANNGMNLELCAREIVMFSLLEQENVTVVDGTLTSLEQFSPDSLPATDTPINFTHGFYTFTVTPDEPGNSVDLVLNLPTSLAPGYSWAKYSLTDGEWIDWGSATDKKAIRPDGLRISADRMTVTLTITDNGPYDDDDTLGVISESSGAGLFDIAFENVSAAQYLTDDIGVTDSDSSSADTDDTTDSNGPIDTDIDTETGSVQADSNTDSSPDTVSIDTNSADTHTTDTSTDSNGVSTGDTTAPSADTDTDEETSANGCSCSQVGFSPSSTSLWKMFMALLL